MKHYLNTSLKTSLILIAFSLSMAACSSDEPIGLSKSQPAATTVAMDFYKRPLPEIPLPNNIATRFDPESPTLRRINASMVAPTAMEERVRSLINQLDGWGTLQPIMVPFTAPLDVTSIMDAHPDDNFDMSDDVIYVVNVDESSSKYGMVHPLDLGNGNYPVSLERRNNYWKHDPRGGSVSLLFEETDEDLNGNGILDLGEDLNGNQVLDEGEDLNGNGVLDLPEDSDADGVLDKPNYLPGTAPAIDDITGRVDSLMTFYENQSNTLIARLMEPLDEQTTYAVIITRRLKDADGKSVGSPFDFINHTAQSEELWPLLQVMPEGLQIEDIAYTWSFTTQTVQSAFVAIRDGLYGHGVQKHLGEDFPAELATIETMRDDGFFPDMKNPHIMYSEEWSAAFAMLMEQFEAIDPASVNAQMMAEAQKYVDYYVVGSFDSPQLFERAGEDGKWLPLDEQSWPADLTTKPAPTRSERVYFTLSIPRKEVSRRGNGGQVPVAIMSHGYGSNRFEGMQMAGFFARQGFATISIDGPSHGLPLNEIQSQLAKAVLSGMGLGSASDAIGKDRAHNQDKDAAGIHDSGADFWTAYLFHTRDVVRQFALDYMQTVRVIKSFDGLRHWNFDVDGNGHNELAGDFDGDGQIEIGSESEMVMIGGSLGGIMSMIMSGLEPALSAAAPIAGGGGFGDMGIRTTQGGAIEGFVLRAMGPFFAGTLDAETGTLQLETIVIDLNSKRVLPLGSVEGVAAWDTILVENTRSGELGCGYVNAQGQYRSAIAADAGDPVEIRVYAGPQLAGGEDCELREGAELKATVDQFGETIPYQDQTFNAGEPLVSIVDGLGLRRCNPDLRRFLGLGQLVLDPSDPVSFARSAQREPIYYPGTQEYTGTHVLQITTLGDTSVPATSGVTWGRALGTIDYLSEDERYSSSANQMLIDTYTTEGVHNLGRYYNTGGAPVHLDIENFSQGTDMWGDTQPRSDIPPRLGMDKIDKLGGVTASIFPMGDPQGQHGFDMPGRQIDTIRKSCLNSCDESLADNPNPCNCIEQQSFDVGTFMFGMIGEYFKSFGTQLNPDLCHSHRTCGLIPDPPTARDTAVLP